MPSGTNNGALTTTDAPTSRTNLGLGSAAVVNVPITVANGGTGLATLTSHDLIVGNGTSNVNLLAPSATSGVPVISQGSAADPIYGTVVVAGGGTGVTSFTAFTPICGGTTTTGALQSVASLGTIGQVLQSQGASALPAFGFGVVQQIRTSTSALNHITTVTPFDDTIPQNNEGVEVFTVTITPKSATNILVIETIIWGTPNTANSFITTALFQDTTANALAATCTCSSSAGAAITGSLMFSMAAGTTSATTFKIRCGPQTGTFDINGSGSNARIFGGVGSCTLKVTEYTA